jgi:hypothetical protein
MKKLVSLVVCLFCLSFDVSGMNSSSSVEELSALACSPTSVSYLGSFYEGFCPVSPVRKGCPVSPVDNASCPTPDTSKAGICPVSPVRKRFCPVSPLDIAHCPTPDTSKSH